MTEYKVATQNYVLASHADVGNAARLLWANSTQLSTAAVSATNYAFAPQASDVAASFNVGTVAGARQFYGFYYTSGEQSIASTTTKLLFKVTIATNNVAPAITYTITLNAATIVTGTLTIGSAVSGSTITAATPGNNAFTAYSSNNFTEPSNGFYVPVITISGTPSAGVSLFGRVFARNV